MKAMIQNGAAPTMEQLSSLNNGVRCCVWSHDRFLPGTVGARVHGDTGSSFTFNFDDFPSCILDMRHERFKILSGIVAGSRIIIKYEGTLHRCIVKANDMDKYEIGWVGYRPDSTTEWIPLSSVTNLVDKHGENDNGDVAYEKYEKEMIKHYTGNPCAICNDGGGK